MKMLVAAFVFATCHRGSELITNIAFLMHKLRLLLIKVDELSILYFKDLVCPKSATYMNIHV